MVHSIPQVSYINAFLSVLSIVNIFFTLSSEENLLHLKKISL